MEQTYMKEKPILQLVLSMSLPMVLSMTVNSLYNIVDSLFVARISENAMTSLSLVFPIQNLVNSIAVGFAIGINAMIAFFMGAKEQKKADWTASAGVLLSILHGIIMMAVCIFIMPSFLRMFTLDEEVINLGVQYSNMVFGFSVVTTLGCAFEKIFQSVGRMTVSMMSMLCGCVINIILDPILIFGLGPFPAMGMEGAAIATVIGQVLSLVVYLIFCLIHPLPVKICLKYLTGCSFSLGNNTEKIKPLNMLWKIYAIGIPATLNMALPSLMISSLNSILAAYSQAYVVVLGAYNKLQTFLYLSSNGIVQGIRPLIGYNYGAGEHKRVRKVYNLSLSLIVGMMILGTDSRSVNWNVQQQWGNCSGRRCCSAHHQHWIYIFCSFRYLLRCPGRNGKGFSIPDDFSFQICCHYPSGRFCAELYFGSFRCMARLLDYRSTIRFCIVFHIPKSSTELKKCL